jgi:hypothetical protein
MSDKKNIRHSEPRLIAGVFREALLTGREILLTNNSERVWTAIKDIKENSARDRNQRQLIVKHGVSLSSDVEVLIPFGRYVFRGKMKQVGAPDEKIFQFPDLITQETQRKFERFKLDDGSNWSKVTLVQADITVVGDFCLEDIGYDSIRGLVIIPSEIHLRQDSLIVGTITSSKGNIKINGRVIRAAEIVSGEEQVFRIVVKQSNHGRKQSQEALDDDRRSERRFCAGINLKLNTDFLEKHLNLQVTEVTSTTFRGTVIDPLQISSAIFGVEYKICGQQMIVHLIANRGKEFVFEILSSDETSSKWWFNTYSAAVQPTLYSDTIETNDVLRLFCEAGAFSTNYIRGNKLNSKNIEEGFSSAQTATWLHRWIEVKNGKFTGYVSAINLIKDVWFIGDLVGGQTDDNKISPQFMSSFFYAFTRYLKAFKPDHLILMTWIKDHPYWRTLQKHIKDNESEVLASVGSFYTRITGEAWAHTLRGNFGAVTPSDPKKEAFDHANFSKGERALALKFSAASASAAAKRVNRDLGGATSFFQVNSPKGKVFCFYIDIQEGASINKFPQSIFVFDPNRILDSPSWPEIKNTIVAYCNQNSLFPASIRRIAPSNADEPLDGEMAEMSLYLVNPELFNAYE